MKALVGGGSAVAIFAIVEARTGFNVFRPSQRVLPAFQPTELGIRAAHSRRSRRAAGVPIRGASRSR